MRVAVILAAGVLVLALAGVAVYYSRSAGPTTTAPSAAATPVPAPNRPEPATASRPAPSRPAAPTPAPTTAPVEPDAPTTGTLVVESDVPDTSVFLDRVYKGHAPLTITDLAPGSYRLNVSAAGYDGVLETIEIKAGTQTMSMTFKDIRLDESLAVVHRHAIGSCTGTLRATPKGLTYDTTHESDRFTVALTDIETFAFDYLEKNLRVKIRGGKTYNFTDPGGQPDPLYRFHQPVEKARQRLLAGRRP